MYEELLSHHQNPGPAERQQAAELVRAHFIQFEPEKKGQNTLLEEPPDDLEDQKGARKPGEYQTLIDSLTSTGTSKGKTTP
jgi:hypothetical protein